MGDAILRIPRDARVRAYSTRDTYDGVVPATSKRQPYCHSSYIELSASNPTFSIQTVERLDHIRPRGISGSKIRPEPPRSVREISLRHPNICVQAAPGGPHTINHPFVNYDPHIRSISNINDHASILYKRHCVSGV